MTNIHKPKLGDPVDTKPITLTRDSGWKTVKRVRKLESEHQGITYGLEKRIELPYTNHEDYILKLVWYRNGEVIPSRNVPHQVLRFLQKAADSG